MDASGRCPPSTPLRDRVPFSRGEKVGYGIAAALWFAIVPVLFWGDRAWDSCVANATGDADLCGIAMLLAVLVALVLGVLGLVAAGVTAWQRARRLRREHRLPVATDE